MAEILQNWLNKEIELSKSVDQFEKDFANGYLLGELLFKFNQQSNFHEFSTKENVAAKIDNFTKLQPTLRKLQIKFDSKMIDGIMKEERGVALRLLYQLKMSLEKVYPPTDVSVLKKTGKIGDNRPAMKMINAKQAYEDHATTFFHQRLQVLNKPQKQIIMERHLQKFEDEKLRQDSVANQGDREEREARERYLQELRASQINKVARNAGFMEEWLQKGVQDWQKNQTLKKNRERRDLEFEYKETEKYHQLALTKIDEASKEVNDGISQFEKTLKNNFGIDTKVKKQDAERAVSQNIQDDQNSPMRNSGKSQRFASMSSKITTLMANPFNASIKAATIQGNFNGPAMTLTTTGLRSKDKKVISEGQRKDRERRRRKMIVDQMSTYQDMESKRRQDQVLERMKRQAKQEEELDYEKWRTEQCKNVINDNRKLREARYEKRREIDTQTAQWREEEMLKSMKEKMNHEIETLKQRDEEMRVLSKKAQRERRNEFGAVLFDAIFEISNEAYNHQQMSDSPDIDSRNWHEWLQLFIDEMPIQGTLSKLAELKSLQDIVSGSQTPVETEEAQQTFLTQNQLVDPHEKLDHMELTDYLKNKGQWTTDLITENPPNLEQFLTGQNDAAPVAAAAKGGAKGAPAKAATEAVTLEEGDADLPTEAPNNYQLGDAIEQVIQLNFEARASQKRPQMPQYLNLKLCFIGYAFAGKKTQAQMLAESYGLQTYQMSDLVLEVVTFFENNPNPIETKKTEGEEALNNEERIEEMSFDSEINEGYSNESVQEDFRQVGEKIADLLKEGQEIPDEIYVQLYITKLRLAYPHKSKSQIRAELTAKVQNQREIQKKIEPLEKELNEILNPKPIEEGEEAAAQTNGGKKKKKAQDPKQLQAKIDELKKEIEKQNEPAKDGWILIDFPSTYAQAKLLETALSGYVTLTEQDPIDREKQTSDAFLLVQPTEKEQPPKRLIKSGLDAVVWFDLSRDQCMNRAVGRLFDPETGKVYHIDDVKPPTNEAPLCERLVPMDEDQNLEATLIDRWMSFDQGAGSLNNWLSQFGESKSDRSILYNLDASKTQAEMGKEIQKIVDAILIAKQERDEAIKAKINAKIESAEQEEAERVRKAAEEEEERKKRDEEGAEGGEIKKEEAKVERPEPATERVAAKEPGVNNIDGDFKPTILKVWQELSETYKGQMKKVFRQVRVQRERMTAGFDHLQKQYLEFVHRPDTKQEKLEQFIKDFNDFSDQFPDLREDESTKDELHQRVDTLSDELWEIIEDRKEQHVEERKKIMESGWVEHELAFLVSSGQSLMQAEVDKFKSSIQILQDFYHAFEDKLIPEPPAMITSDILGEGEDLPAIEVLPEGADALNAGSYTYPRLDKIFEKALKTQFVADVTLNAAAGLDKKGAPPAKGKDPKKPAEDEKPAEESQYVKEMKQAIKVEKSILRFRLTQIRNWVLKRLRDVRAKANRVYTKLEDWVHVANKAENDAVDEMCIVVKRAIEEETKIQDELRIKFMDFCVDEKIMNFIEPPPDKLAAMEQVRPDRFNIRQLRTLVDELQEFSKHNYDGHGGVPNKVLIDLFLRKLEISKVLWDDGCLPEEWWSLGEYDFQNLVRNLDRSGSGSVNWKQLATFIILLKSPLPSEEELETYKKTFSARAGKDQLLDEAAFVQVPAWFDATEYSQDRDYSIAFPRVQYIKELLFRVHREHELPAQKDERIAFEDLQQAITSARKVVQNNIIKRSDVERLAKSVKTFSDVLFMQASLPHATATAGNNSIFSPKQHGGKKLRK